MNGDEEKIAQQLLNGHCELVELSGIHGIPSYLKHSFYQAEKNKADFVDYVSRSLAHKIGEKLLEEGFISIETNADFIEARLNDIVKHKL